MLADRMARTGARLLAVLLLAMAAQPAVQAADLAVMPVSVKLDRQRDRGTVHVTNNGAQTVVLQADSIGWRREAGVDQDAPTSDLLVNPPVFTLEPGRTQVVRVGLRRALQGDQESTYRLVLREVPATGETTGAVTGQVRVLMALRLPVYVAPGTVRSEQRWVAQYDAQGQVLAQVTNTGNVHFKIGALHWPGDAKPAAVQLQGPASVVFPGEVRRVVLRAPDAAALAGANAGGNANPGTLSLDVMTEQGPQRVALDLPRR